MDKKLMFYQKDLGRSSLQRPQTQHPPFSAGLIKIVVFQYALDLAAAGWII